MGNANTENDRARAGQSGENELRGLELEDDTPPMGTNTPP